MLWKIWKKGANNTPEPGTMLPWTALTSIVRLTKKYWKFLHSAEQWYSTDKKTCTVLKSWINAEKITCTVLKPWINADKITCTVLKHWTLNSADLHNAASLVAQRQCCARPYCTWPRWLSNTRYHPQLYKKNPHQTGLWK